MKPLKVAGTSFELALRDYCGSEDIITMCTPEDERISLKRNKTHFQNENNGAKYFDHVIGLDVDFHVSGNVMNNDCYQGMGTILRVFEANSQRYYNHIEAQYVNHENYLLTRKGFAATVLLKRKYEKRKE